MSQQNQQAFPRLISSLLYVCVSGACISSAHADALLDEPLALSERAPLVQRFNLPSMRSGQVLGSGASQWRLGIDIANNYVRDTAGAEAMVFDGESQRYELGVRYGLGDRWEVGVMLPWISYNGGVLDSFIDDWHSLWGFPDHGRSDHPTRKLHFSHSTNGLNDFNFQDAEAGIGDVQVQVANQIFQTERDSVALIANLNLPTGDDEELTGSGGTSVAIVLAATHVGLFDLPLTLTGNIGAQTLPESDVLDNRQKKSAWFGSGEIAWAVTQDSRVRLQVSTHSAIYDSELTSLGETSTQLLLGGTVRLTPRWVLDIALGEDIALDTAPDVTMQLALKARY